jgi:hypothetical protein
LRFNQDRNPPFFFSTCSVKEEAGKAQQETQKTSEVAEQVEKKKGGFLSWLKFELALQPGQEPALLLLDLLGYLRCLLSLLLGLTK